MSISFTKLLWLLLVAVAGLFCLSLMLPNGLAAPKTPASFLLAGLLGDNADIERIILIELRIPRASLALVMGSSLGLAGAAMQGLLQNPLAEPGVVGVSGSAALGAALAFYSGLSTVMPLALPLGGILGALIAVALLFMIAGKRASTATLLLAGIAINAIAGALTALLTTPMDLVNTRLQTQALEGSSLSNLREGGLVVAFAGLQLPGKRAR